jgi:enoyl-CoA hydratase/carnithine racemase
MSQGAVTLHIEGPVARIVIDSAARMNAMSTAMWRAFPALVAEADANPDVRLIVVTGAGEAAFSAGADISEFGAARSTPSEVKAYDDLNTAALEALWRCEKPTVAVVRGFCLGGGFAIAMSCDLRLASADATFGVPAARLGLGYNPRWMRPLLSAMSAASVKEMLFTGDRFGADAALRMGAVNRVFTEATFEVDADAVLARVAQNAPLSIRASKAAIDAVAGGAPDFAALDAMVDACFASADYAEGRAAFAAKRKPVFNGR